MSWARAITADLGDGMTDCRAVRKADSGGPDAVVTNGTWAATKNCETLYSNVILGDWSGADFLEMRRNPLAC
jgi:hypothetical protein